MKVYAKVVSVRTYGPMVLHPITGLVEEVLAESGAKSGVAWVSVEGATPALVLLRRGVEREFVDYLSKLLLFRDWRHGNAYAHLASTLLSTTVAIPVVSGALALGRDEELYLLETRSVYNHERRIAVEVHGSSG